MKNFKKVIAFLMVAAMTLGMGAVAFAATDDAVDAGKTEALAAGKIEEAKAGDTVTIKVLTNQSLAWNAGKLVITLDPEYVKTGKDDVVNDANEFLDAVWKMKAGAQVNYFPAEGRFEASAAGVSANNPKSFVVAAGTTVAELKVVLAKDVKAGDKIATASCEFITDESSTPGTKITINPKDVSFVVSEKATETETETSTNVPDPTDPANVTDPTGVTGAQNGTNAPAATVKDIVTKDDALNALDTLAKATAAAAKLNKAAFASDADYQAFTKALAEANKVLNNSKATDAEKAAALKTLKDAMAKADEKALVAAVKAVVNAAPATTKAGNGKTKTGDTAPVAVLMIVAIAAFGTAVVVYRKKVNA